MIFTNDTEFALMTAAALINSAEEPETLETLEQLDLFLDEFEMTGRRDGTAKELADVRRLRAVLRPLWTEGEAEVAELCNGLLRQAKSLPQLVKHGHWDWHLHAVENDQPVVDRLAVETAMAMVDVLRAGELERLRECAAEDCGGVVVDLSKNRSRRYCEQGCGNRANVAAYRARQRAGEDPPNTEPSQEETV